MNKTTLTHLTMQAKIFAAMRRAILTGLPQYILNKKGNACMRVNYSRNTSNAFTFWAHNQKNITNTVLATLRDDNLIYLI